MVSEQRIQEALAAEDARIRASLALDVDALRELLLPELIFIHSNALIDTRDSYLERLSSKELTYDRYESLSSEVPFASDEVAIAMTRLDLSARFRGQTIESRVLVLTTWVRSGLGLRAASMQSTLTA